MRALKALLTITHSSLFSHSLHHFNGIQRRPLHLSSPLLSFLHSQKGKAGASGCTGICNRPFCSLDYECNEIHGDDKAVEKDTALRLAISQVANEFGKESMLSMQRFFRSRYTPIVSTGSLKLDLALGIGGLPKGRMIEIYGSEASGKTTLALHVIKESQKHGGYCAYVDVENAMDSSLAESIGVNTENLLIARPNSAENLLNIVDTLTKSGSMEVIVVDSVAALVPQRELGFDDGPLRDFQSQLLAKALRKIHSSLCRSETLLIFVNQVRSKPNGGFGNASEVTCGGNALKFYAAVRMRIRRVGLIKDEDEVAGLSACIQIVKNKLAPSMKKVDLEIRFGRGISHEAEVLEIGCEHGVILKRGNGYCIEGEILENKQEAVEYLARNNEILNKVVTTLRSQLFV